MPDSLTSFSIAHKLEGLSDSSRVWIWQSNQPFSKEQVESAEGALSVFVEQWTSHNKELKAKALIENDRFIIVCLDQEVSSAASGCSIDSLTHAIQNIGHRISVDLFDRNVCYYLEADEIRMVKLNDLEQLKSSNAITGSTLVFDPLLNSKSKLLSDWPKAISESWHRGFL